MIQHVWSVLCTRSVVDKDTNNISLNDVIEQIRLPEVPEPGTAAKIEAQIVSLWSRTDLEEEEVGEGRWTIEPAEGEAHEGDSFPIDLTEFRRLRTRIGLDALPLGGVGVYWIRIEFRYADDEDWRSVANIPLEVQTAE